MHYLSGHRNHGSAGQVTSLYLVLLFFIIFFFFFFFFYVMDTSLHTASPTTAYSLQ